MNARSTRAIPFLIVMAILAAAAAAAGAAYAADASYPIRNLEPSDALMALNIRVPSLGQECKVTVTHAQDPSTAGLRGTLDVRCNNDAMLSKIQAAVQAIDVPLPTHRFHVVILGASREDGPSPELPPGESKALADFKKVMTYRSFRIEAETIVQSSREAQTQVNTGYIVELLINPTNSGGDTVEVRRFALRGVDPRVSPTGEQSHTSYVETSFSIRKGETLVLGSSISDKQARVVLVTALP
jgi:hypothetical protein